MRFASWLATAVIFLGSTQLSWCQTAPGNDPDRSLEAAPGPMQQERASLAGKIDQASQRGVGVAPYVSLFNEIETKAAAGASTVQLEPLVNNLSEALDNQLSKIPPPEKHESGERTSSASKGRTTQATKSPIMISPSSSPAASTDPSQLSPEEKVERRKQLVQDYESGKINRQQFERAVSQDGLPLAQRSFRSPVQAGMWARQQLRQGRDVTIERTTQRRRF